MKIRVVTHILTIPILVAAIITNGLGGNQTAALWAFCALVWCLDSMFNLLTIKAHRGLIESQRETINNLYELTKK